MHHIIELSAENVNNINVSLNPMNLASKCSICHKRITREAHRKGGGILPVIFFDDEGNPNTVADPRRGPAKKSGTTKTDGIPDV